MRSEVLAPRDNFPHVGARRSAKGDHATAAREYGNSGASLPLGERELTEIERLQGGRPPGRYPAAAGTGFDVDHFVRALFQDTYNRRDLSAIDRAYVPNVRWHGGSLREGYGRADVRRFARGLMATFPDLGLHVDEVYWMGNEAEGFSVSVRWTVSQATSAGTGSRVETRTNTTVRLRALGDEYQRATPAPKVL